MKEVRLLNNQGNLIQLVPALNINLEENYIDISSQSSGNYFVQTLTYFGSIETYSLILEKP